MEGHSQHVAFIWSVADLLRGDYKQSEYGKVILPLTVLRRLDCVLEATKPAVLKAAEIHGHRPNPDPILRRAAGVDFYNTSPLDFRRLLDDPQQLKGQLQAYIAGFSPGAFETFQRFNFDEQIVRLDEADLLYLVVGRFADIDLHPDVVSNLQMGYVFEELIRRFSEQSNETAGEHFTPREVIRLMVDLLFAGDSTELRTKGIVKTLYDPACGTGGMLSAAEEYLRELNPDGRLEVFGQELNAESYAICRSDMMLKGQDAGNIAFGNTLSNDQHPRRFDYMLSNPPFGVEWKKIEVQVKHERDTLGHSGRFGAGLPRINDGSFLFLQHMISKMKPAEEGGSRIAIVFNGSPLFTGAAGSGESEIRRWIIENDWLEAVVALPDQLFYNTGISTYVWVVTNAKAERRLGKVQLIDARERWEKMPKSLGEKRKRIADAGIAEIARWYEDFAETDTSKVFDNEAFGFRRVTVERPKRVRVDLEGAGERMDGLADKLGEDVVAAVKAATASLKVPAGSSVADAATAIAKALPKLPAAKKKLVVAAFLPRDPDGDVATDGKGRPEPDLELRDHESIPLVENVEDYIAREVLPHAPDAWVDESKSVVGYEIPLTRHFYRCLEPRSLEEIDAEIDEVEQEILRLLEEVRG
ncbi:N-6 DNA methylase [Conexibacter sp. W3-3-2]|uniref:type I restriction-modification system subunit M n=1 Tax=Conexibacter sp. W3-3-2 TaxID=2675227 RepID=UPI0012B75961|nr:class I SAM-dependent DNA methyltransferase [Conexibacter sp. W3-3-2]MTD44856.1 N-6 DNA methylase [Conexibacter sp. W3-3-2]